MYTNHEHFLAEKRVFLVKYVARLGSFHFISASFPIDEASQNAIPEKKK